jgi:pre-mRNA-splicing factor SPF27
MPLTNHSFDSLPYIDASPTASERTAAQHLIDTELSSLPQTTTHPRLPSSTAAFTSPLLQAEIQRLETDPTSKLTAIDLSAYEVADAPTPSLPLPEVSKLVRQTAISSIYLQHRLQNLETLSSTGKETWLSSNDSLTQILKDVEKELADTKEDLDRLAVARRSAQEAVAGEMGTLERSWKGGIGRVLEAEVAAEGLRGRAYELRMGGGGGQEPEESLRG